MRRINGLSFCHGRNGAAHKASDTLGGKNRFVATPMTIQGVHTIPFEKLPGRVRNREPGSDGKEGFLSYQAGWW